MSEYAEMINDGVICEECGEFLRDAPLGYPSLCDECVAEGDEAKREPNSDFLSAKELAEHHGMKLIKKSDLHYQLENGWLLNLYPSNGRLYTDQNKAIRAPYLGVKPPWTFTEIVEAAICKGEELK